MHCHNCNRVFLSGDMKWKDQKSPLCRNYPLCSSSWSQFDISFKGFKPVPVADCIKHPKYRGFKIPLNGCTQCEKIYMAKNLMSPEGFKMYLENFKYQKEKENKKKEEVCWYCKNKRGYNCHICHGKNSPVCW